MACPVCGRETVNTCRPFCSKRCADVDLARWFNGTYAVPSSEIEDEDALEAALSQAREQTGKPKPH